MYECFVIGIGIGARVYVCVCLCVAGVQVSDMTSRLDTAQTQLHQVEQPYNFLIETITARESQLKIAQQSIQQLQQELQHMTGHYNAAVVEKQKLANELDKLLQTRQVCGMDYLLSCV